MRPRPKKRKIKCRDCIYYNENNNTCESKKLATNGNHPYVNWLDRLFCEPRKGVKKNDRIIHL